MPPTSDWQTFLGLQAGAAATLTGLVFVAVSINITKILTIPGLPGRAAESMLQFLQVFFMASVMLIPRQSLAAQGYEAGAIAACTWLAQVFSQMRYARSQSGHPRRWLLGRTVATQMASIPLFAGSIALLCGNPDGLYVMVPGFLLSFIAGVSGAWVLLVEILR